MSGNKKPRKAYREKLIHVPMMPESRDTLAMQLHAAVETLIHAPSVDACNEVSKKLAIMNHAGLQSVALSTAIMVIDSVIDRFIRVKKIGISQSETETLQTAAGQLDRQLATIPVNVLKASRYVVNQRFERINAE